jgi:CheY-like chemotaxis protein
MRISRHCAAKSLWYAQAALAIGDGMARILVVDDEPLIAALVEDWLSDLGHVVVGPAHNLAQALELGKSDIDAAIVDVSLGKDNSYPLVDALIARGLPFALATGYGLSGVEPKYRDQPILGKPFEFPAFRAAIDQLIADEGIGADAPSAPAPDPISATR